ncbi:MAG: hypothetical protein RL709_969, partial [Pseudomonadota bacterium]
MGRIAGKPIQSRDVGGDEMKPAFKSGDNGSAALNFDGSKKTHDVVHGYPWTLSKVQGRDDIPHIILSEHRCTETVLARQMKFYTQAGVSTAKNAANMADSITGGAVGRGIAAAGRAVGITSESGSGLLDVYEEMFPDAPTGIKYIFPYFSKTFMELNTDPWKQVDDAGTKATGIAEGISDVAKTYGGDWLKKKAEGFDKYAIAGGKAAGAVNDALLEANYPVVGIFDRPRLFASHSERTITIEFPLYNTKSAHDWKQNRDLCYKLMTQNLYNKRDYITGSPPCFYRVFIPGQYFCFACSIASINITNLGNVRTLYGSYNVPDAYQLSITLREMLMPSLNQFQAMTNGEAEGKVSVG